MKKFVLSTRNVSLLMFRASDGLSRALICEKLIRVFHELSSTIVKILIDALIFCHLSVNLSKIRHTSQEPIKTVGRLLYQNDGSNSRLNDTNYTDTVLLLLRNYT